MHYYYCVRLYHTSVHGFGVKRDWLTTPVCWRCDCCHSPIWMLISLSVYNWNYCIRGKGVVKFCWPKEGLRINKLDKMFISVTEGCSKHTRFFYLFRQIWCFNLCSVVIVVPWMESPNLWRVDQSLTLFLAEIFGWVILFQRRISSLLPLSRLLPPFLCHIWTSRGVFDFCRQHVRSISGLLCSPVDKSTSDRTSTPLTAAMGVKSALPSESIKSKELWKGRALPCLR